MGNAIIYHLILSGDLKSVTIPQCIYSKSLYLISNRRTVLYIIHFSPEIGVGLPQVLPGGMGEMDGIGGMSGMDEMAGMGGMGRMGGMGGMGEMGGMGWDNGALLKLVCDIKALACGLLPFLPFCNLLPFCNFIG